MPNMKFKPSLRRKRLQVEGETQRFKGAWTHVFNKYGDDWRVIQSNGTHIFY
jgi:hypothetical protein